MRAPPVDAEAASPRPPAWRLRLLDEATLCGPDGRAVAWPGRAAVLLLARLALPPQRAWGREELIELLWPGTDPATGRNRLRQLLSVLRRAVAHEGTPPLLLAEGDTVRLRHGALACDAGDPSAPGELLPGHYAEWVQEERRRRSPVPPPLPARPSLPHALTRWRGDPALLERLRAAVRAHRVVTVTGPGGCGKTRAALEAAHGLAADFERVVWVPLAACDGVPAMWDQCLGALGLGGGSDPLATLDGALAGRRVLLLLDNLEQLAVDAALPLSRLVSDLPGLHLLATSRRTLDVDGERAFALSPLGAPAARLSLDALARHPAMALLLDRAQAVRPDFRLHAGNADPLVALLERLDGLPLAIELAAARLRSAEPPALLAMLPPQGGSAFALLERAGPRGGHDARHASMLETLRWSWSLLTPPARAMLDACAVFEGPFDADAAAAVADAGSGPAALAVDELVRHSLLRFEPGPPPFTLPFTLHPLTREAVLQALPEPRRAALRARLRVWAAAWARALPARPPLAAVRQALPNLAGAMRSAGADGVPRDALALFALLQRALSDIALPPATQQALCRCADRLDAADERATARAALARAALRSGDGVGAQALAAQALAELPAAGPARALVLARVAHIRWRLARDASVAPWLDEALAIAREAGDAALQGSVLSVQGAMCRPSDPVAAAALQRAAIAAWDAAGDAHGVLTGRYNLALALGMRAETRAEALAEIAQVVAATRTTHDWGQLATACNQRGELLRAERRWDEAVAAYREGIRVADEALEPLPLAYCLWNLPQALAPRGDAAAAATLMGFAAAHWAARIGPLGDADRRDLRRVRRLAAASLGAARTAEAEAAGAALPLSAAVRLALHPAR